MPRATCQSLPRTTSTGRASEATRWLARSVGMGDVHGIRRAIQENADPLAECCSTALADGTRLGKLTAASLAALVDANDDSLFLLPLLLNVGADIEQIDSQGRTLLHFARTRRVARYLIEHGVPVAPDMRSSLLDAFTRPHGEVAFAKHIELGIRDKAGNEPWIFRAVRKQTARHWRRPEGPVIPRRQWRKALDVKQYNGLIGIGFNESEAVRMARDVLYVPDDLSASKRPPLVAELSATSQLMAAVERRDHRRAKVLLDIGASPTLERADAFLEVGDSLVCWSDVTSVGHAVILACDAIHRAGTRASGASKSSQSTDGLTGQARVLSAFADVRDLNGVHAAGGCTLMHLAYAPEVARWLINEGVPVDVPDKRGRLPEEVVPTDSASVMLNVRLQQALPVVTASSGRRRL